MKKRYIASTILLSLIPILTTLLIIGLLDTEINYKTQITLSIILSLLSIIVTSKLYLSKSLSKYNISQFISITTIIILLFNIYNINKDYDYIQNIITGKYIYTNNSLYVLKNTKYRSITDLKTKTIGILEQNNKNSEELLTKKYNKINYITYTSKEKMINDLKNGKIQAILLSENDTNILKNTSNKIIKETRSIFETKIKSNI